MPEGHQNGIEVGSEALIGLGMGKGCGLKSGAGGYNDR
jgi:hypothetical protein